MCDTLAATGVATATGTTILRWWDDGRLMAGWVGVLRAQ